MTGKARDEFIKLCSENGWEIVRINNRLLLPAEHAAQLAIHARKSGLEAAAARIHVLANRETSKLDFTTNDDAHARREAFRAAADEAQAMAEGRR